jgi:DNA-binding NarL/FixJ family response regulator
MLEPLRPERKLNDTDSRANEPLYKRPDVNLLDDRQWLYVQRHNRLSPRELQVAKHICRGFPNEEVATCLSIRSGTVKTHLRNIYRRIHVTNKIGMLLTFVEQAAAFSGEHKTSSGAVVVKGQQIKPNLQPSDSNSKHEQTGL